jgi:hypothetical protein
MDEQSWNNMLVFTWLAGVIFVAALLLYALCHRCPVTACQNPACCKVAVEAPTK